MLQLSLAKKTVEMGDRITSILAQWRHYPRLKICTKLNIYRPQESAWKPPLPQYATTLSASGSKVQQIKANNIVKRKYHQEY